MQLILLRHTRPLEADGLCYGQLDLDLAGCFDDHAERLSRDLPSFSRIVSSPLSRCRKLADLLAAARGMPVDIEPDLREMSFGAWEGRLWSEVPRAELDLWAEDLLHARPHGGESVYELLQRVEKALENVAKGDVTLAVTHAGVIKAALVSALGERAWREEIAFGGWVALDAQKQIVARGG